MAAHASSQELTDEDAAVLQFPKGKQKDFIGRRLNKYLFYSEHAVHVG